MDSFCLIAGIVLERSALATGFAAAAIAVGGFLARSRATLTGETTTAVQQETAVGGLTGLGLSVWIVLLDAVMS